VTIDSTTGLIFTALAGGLAFVAWVVRRRPTLFGPLVRHELVRLARGGQQPLLRSAVVLLTLAGLFVTYLYEGEGLDRAQLLSGGASLPQDRMAGFGETFLVAFLVVQLAAVVLVAPVVMGGGISDERERGTLDDLRTTMLSPREIIWDKFLARLVYVWGVAFAGLPVLVMATLFGGVDLATLLAGTAVIALSAASLGSHAILLSVRRDGLRDALVPVYGWLAALTVGGACCGFVPGVAALSPLSALLWLFAGSGGLLSLGDVYFWATVGGFAVVHGGWTARNLRKAVRALTADRPVRAVEPAFVELPQLIPVYGVEPRPLRPVWVTVDRSHHPPADGPPFLWKERTFTGRYRRRLSDEAERAATGTAVLLAGLLLLGVVLCMVVIGDIGRHQWAGDAFTPVLRLLLAAAAVLAPLLAGVRAAAGVARERERGTLDGLLTLPDARADILWAKWLGPLWSVRWVLGPAAGFALLTLAVGGVFPLGLVTAAVHVAGLVGFAVSFGVWQSVRCRTVTRATVGVVVMLFTLLVGPVVLAPLVAAVAEAAGWATAGDGLTQAVTAASGPIGVPRALAGWPRFETPSWEEVDPPAQAANLVMGGGLAAAAWGLWRAAKRRFERLGR